MPSSGDSNGDQRKRIKEQNGSTPQVLNDPDDVFFKAIPIYKRWEAKGASWDYVMDPNAIRRRIILKKHPEIKKFFVSDPTSALFIAAEVAVQLGVAWCMAYLQASWPVLVLAAYMAGLLSFSLLTGVHELSHKLVFGLKHPWINGCFLVLSNLAFGFPVGLEYKKHHMQHHRRVGHDIEDIALPAAFELQLCSTLPGRLVYVLFMPAFEAIRTLEKRLPRMTRLGEFGIILQVAFDVASVLYWGPKPLAYLVLSSWFGLGAHPISGLTFKIHSIIRRENDFQASHSYYGPLNRWIFNFGYHLEHHDFPAVPSRYLPKVHEIAKEFYDPLPSFNSSIGAFFQFLFDPDFGIGQHASNVVCAAKPELYAEGTRPQDTRDFCRRFGIHLPDEELSIAMKMATDKADEDSDSERITSASLADD